jgi:hypothetical protein
MARPQALQSIEFSFHPFRVAQQANHVMRDDLARGGELQASSKPLEQRMADFCLQPQDLPIYCG